LTLPEVNAVDDPSDVGFADAVIVAVKAWQVPEVGNSIRPIVGDKTLILPIQNGVEAPWQLASIYGGERVLGGMCRVVALKTEPNHIVHVGVDPFIALGHLDNHTSQRALELAAAFRQAGVGAKIPTDIHSSMWQKFLFIAPVSGVGAVARVPLGRLRSEAETRDLVQQGMIEVATVAKARGVVLPEEAVAKTMAFLDGMPPETTSSMQRDIMHGRPSELEAINGAVVRLGRAVDVSAPINAFLYASLLPLEKQARQSQQVS
jgi:2-dehydropantoate 2-reductase